MTDDFDPVAIARQAEEDCREKSRRNLVPLHNVEFLSTPLDPPGWIFNLLVPKSGLVALSGLFESYKSYFALWLAWRAASGLTAFVGSPEESYLHKPCLSEPLPTLFIEEEMGDVQVQNRIKHFLPPVPDKLYHLINRGFSLSQATVLADICKELGIQLLFLDPFSTIAGSKDENDNSEMSRRMDILRDLFVDQGVTVVFLHHPAKNADASLKNLRGAGDILGKCDVHLCLEVEDTRERKIKVSYEKLRICDRNLISNFRMVFKPADLLATAEFKYAGEALPAFMEERSKLAVDILAAMQVATPILKSEVADVLGVDATGNKFKAVWAELVKDRKIIESAEKVHGNPKYTKIA